MITHILKYLWNRRRQNIFTWTELIVVFVVLFFTVDFITGHIRLYTVSPGMSVDNVWQLRLIQRNYKDNTTDAERKAYFKQLEQLTEAMPEVECVTKLKNFPFWIASRTSRKFDRDSIRKVDVTYEEVSDKYLQAAGLELVKGRWFTKEEVDNEANVIVITANVADEFFHKDSVLGSTDVLGKINKENTTDIVGVVRSIKFADFAVPQHVIFMPYHFDLFFSWGFPKMAIRVKPGVKDFPKIFDEAVREKVRSAEFGMLPLESAEVIREQTNQKITNRIVIYSVITGFLLLTIFLGIGGIFWKRVLMRRSEIGLRMAIGATSRGVNAQVTMEVTCLVLLAFLPAAVICINLAHAELLNTEYFPITAWRVLFDMGIALLLLLAMAVLSTRYPARLAARMQPVEALRTNQ